MESRTKSRNGKLIASTSSDISDEYRAYLQKASPFEPENGIKKPPVKAAFFKTTLTL